MYLIRKQFKFEMAHQLFESYTKACCDQIHGHSYVLELYFKSDKLDKTGMVIDFGEVKDVIKQWVDSWDHSIILPNMFPVEYTDMVAKYSKNFRLVSYNPTAENMCAVFYNVIKEKLPHLSKVRLHETSTGWAEYYE